MPIGSSIFFPPHFHRGRYLNQSSGLLRGKTPNKRPRKPCPSTQYLCICLLYTGELQKSSSGTLFPAIHFRRDSEEFRQENGRGRIKRAPNLSTKGCVAIFFSQQPHRYILITSLWKRSSVWRIDHLPVNPPLVVVWRKIWSSNGGTNEDTWWKFSLMTLNADPLR